MKKIPRQAYTTEFKELAVKRVQNGETVATLKMELGLSDQTLCNWVKAQAEGKLKGAVNKVVTAEQMELFRLRAENSRLTRENEIKKRRHRTSRKMCCEVRMDSIAGQGISTG
ncbi:transposase [Undibacterium sp. JH2W]|uniref:transposase n=1 Tax=Undibacterium sp. JH2W TaxID=3413037 RepID=UPI003BEFAB55